MDPLRILIIEDELIPANDIKETLLQAGYLVSGIARNYEKALEILKRNSPDLALIDIKLDGSVDGIATARTLFQYKAMPIVYLTSNTELATFNRAKETNPAAYLVKPFRMSELPLQIELAIHNFYTSNFTTPARKSDHFLLSVGGIHIRVAKNEILYVEAKGNYSIFHLTMEAYSRIYPHKKVELSMNLGRLVQEHLSDNFYSLSRSAVINLDYVDSIEFDEVLIRQHHITIPEGKRKALLERFNLIKTR